MRLDGEPLNGIIRRYSTQIPNWIKILMPTGRLFHINMLCNSCIFNVVMVEDGSLPQFQVFFPHLINCVSRLHFT